MKIRNFILCGILSLLSIGASAQNVKGVVRGADINEPLIGASVYWLGTNIGMASDLEGKFDVYRVKGYDKLVAAMEARGMDVSAYSQYLDLRKYGSVPHSGFGLGLERIILYITGMLCPTYIVLLTTSLTI